jgi:hypothetical protein
LAARLFGVATMRCVAAEETIRTAHVDPHSELFALQGQGGDRYVLSETEEITARGGVSEVWMRANDTSYDWKTDVRIDSKANILPTTSKMERP